MLQKGEEGGVRKNQFWHFVIYDCSQIYHSEREKEVKANKTEREDSVREIKIHKGRKMREKSFKKTEKATKKKQIVG